jgi:hypothetical protein
MAEAEVVKNVVKTPPPQPQIQPNVKLNPEYDKKDRPFVVDGMEKKIVGREVSDEWAVEPVKFVSRVKSYMLFSDHNYMIIFQNRSLITNNPETIKYLRKHKEFNKEFWEGEFPQWLNEKLENDRKLLTRDPDEYS